MLQWCNSGVTVLLQWCYSGFTVVLQWCVCVCMCLFLTSDLYHSGDTRVVDEVCYKGVTWLTLASCAPVIAISIRMLALVDPLRLGLCV